MVSDVVLAYQVKKVAPVFPKLIGQRAADGKPGSVPAGYVRPGGRYLLQNRFCLRGVLTGYVVWYGVRR